MARIKITISLPESLDEYIRGRMETGNYGSVSEYFRDLARGEQIKIEQMRFERSVVKQESVRRPLFRDENQPRRY